MTLRNKKIFLAVSIIVPFLVYCFYYYGMMVKNAPYKFSEFKSIVFEYGTGDSLLNKYNSYTQQYQYVKDNDSIVKKELFVSKDELLYLHRKAADLGFWDFPAVEINNAQGKRDANVPYYRIQFNYQRKTKTVLFAADYNGIPKLKDANERLIKEIQNILTRAEERSKK